MIWERGKQWGKGCELRSTVGGGQYAGAQEPPGPKRIIAARAGTVCEAFSGGARASRWNRELTSAKDDLGFDRELTVTHRAVCWRGGGSDGHLQSAVFDAKGKGSSGSSNIWHNPSEYAAGLRYKQNTQTPDPNSNLMSR